MICKNCLSEKDLSDFYLKKNGKVKSLYCRICYNIYYKNNKEKRKIYYESNKEYFYNQHKKWINENKEGRENYLKDYRQENKQILSEKSVVYRNNNKEHIREIRKNYYKKRISDPLFRLKKIIRTLIRNSLYRKFTSKSKKTTQILGCSFDEFKIYLESKFDSNMNWGNHGEYWHLDHIKPISLATTEEEVYELNHYTNFQPLYWRDNIIKSNKYNDENHTNY